MNKLNFEQLYAQNFTGILMYICKCIPCKQEAEDLTQEVFVRLLEHGQKIDHTTANAFLFTIARNLVFDTLRHHYCIKAILAKKELNTERSADVTEQDISAHELQSICHTQVSRLTPMRRKVYKLVDEDGWSTSKVATHLNLSIRTVENHLYFARKEIRGHLSRMLRAM